LNKGNASLATTYKQNDGYLAEDLLQSGIHHYEASKVLLNSSPAFFDSGGYILHLAIELMLKSWICHIKGEFGGTHCLQHLRQTLIELGAKLSFTKEESKLLEHFDSLYELRYPNRKTPTEIGSEELKLVEGIVEKLWQSFPDALVDAFEIIPDNQKGGRVLMKKKKEMPIDVKLLTGK
jgi:hypothetical protein